ncbi:MAG TPA: hypothetical protein V6C78_16755 [Crinalium sp.]|jgi:hypothetical protein
MVNDDPSNQDQQPTWHYSVRAFRWVADTLTNPLAQLVADFSEAENLPDLTPALPMVDFSPFQALSDAPDRPPSDAVESSDRPSRLAFPKRPNRLEQPPSRPSVESSVEPTGVRSPQFPIQSPDHRSPSNSSAPLLDSNADGRSPLFSFKQRHSVSQPPGANVGSDRTQQPTTELSQSFRKSENTERFNTVSASSDLSGESMPSGSPLKQSIDLLNTLTDDLLTTSANSSKALQNGEISDRSTQSNSPGLASQVQQNSLALDGTRSPNLQPHSSGLDPSISNRETDHKVEAIVPLKSLTTDLLASSKESLKSPSDNLLTTAKTTETVGWVEPLRNPTPPSIRDTSLSQPTVLPLTDAEQLVALVNDALIEQAQRHGVDLS